MPPRQYSRYTFTNATENSAGKMVLSSVQRFPFVDLPDNRTITTRDGDTLFTLANRYFKPLPRPAGLWWIIAQFQPKPIHDPTLSFETGRVIVIPSIQTVISRIFSEEDRRAEAF